VEGLQAIEKIELHPTIRKVPDMDCEDEEESVVSEADSTSSADDGMRITRTRANH
jgi:hypothetical protein